MSCALGRLVNEVYAYEVSFELVAVEVKSVDRNKVEARLGVAVPVRTGRRITPLLSLRVTR